MDGLIALLISLTLDVVHLVVALVFFRLVLWYANRSGITGSKFYLHTWLDEISEDQDAKAIVIAGLLIAVAIVLHGLVAS